MDEVKAAIDVPISVGNLTELIVISIDDDCECIDILIGSFLRYSRLVSVKLTNDLV